MRTEWQGTDHEAIALLERAGYRLSRGGVWTLPNDGHVPTEEELSAVTYLCDEWDYCYDFRPGARP